LQRHGERGYIALLLAIIALLMTRH
jgi:hypothetical protein